LLYLEHCNPKERSRWAIIMQKFSSW